MARMSNDLRAAGYHVGTKEHMFFDRVANVDINIAGGSYRANGGYTAVQSFGSTAVNQEAAVAGTQRVIVVAAVFVRHHQIQMSMNIEQTGEQSIGAA